MPPLSGKSRRVLVLGSPGAARLLCSQLEARGYVAVPVEDPIAGPGLTLPHWAEPDAIQKMRSALSNLVTSFPHRGGSLPDALHPGISTWGDRPELPVIAQELGLLSYCPPSSALALIANKLNFLTEAERIGIPNRVLTFDPLHSSRELERLMVKSRMQFPLVLRSIHSVGPLGRFVARDLESFEKSLGLWIEQLRHQAGNTLFFAESLPDSARQITIPFARFGSGLVKVFPGVDCSLQTRSRKVIEFCPATGVDEKVEKKLGDWTEKLAEQMRFVGVGSLEFLVEGPRAYLQDGSPRLEAGFRLWEKIAGTAALDWQLAAYEGSNVEPPPSSGWASGIAAHLVAEDPLLQLPQPGAVTELSEKRRWLYPGSEAELLLDASVGTDVPASGHGHLGTLVCAGRDRKQAINLARGILSSEFWIAGALQTNERLIAELLEHPWVREGIFHIGFADLEFTPRLRPDPELARIFGSVCAAHPVFSQPPYIEAPCRWSAGDQWVTADPAKLSWTTPPQADLLTPEMPRISGHVQLSDGQNVRVAATPLHALPAGRWQVRVGQWFLIVRRVPPREKPAPSPKVFALLAGSVHSMLFREGSVVPAHEPFLILESLGYLVPHGAPREIRILRWKVEPEQSIVPGQELAEVELTSSG